MQVLAEGDYELKIDGSLVGRYCARDLRLGVNLAFNQHTPQFKQAQTVAKFNESCRNAEAQAIRLLNTRRGLQSQHKINPDDLDAVRAHYEKFANKKDPAAVMALDYINKWPRYDELRREAAVKAEEAFAHRTPAPHDYAVQPAR